VELVLFFLFGMIALSVDGLTVSFRLLSDGEGLGTVLVFGLAG